jgi:ABC-type glycerol-3-phosphate transport system substrate-binding protein
MQSELLNTFISALTRKGWSVEINADPNTDFKKIGFTYGKNNWHWFTWFPLSSGKEFLDFDYTYSQLTGKTKRGYKHRKRILKSIEKLTGISI